MTANRLEPASEAASPDTLRGIRVVLVGTTHPGNIGASARAMKAMGLDTLHLVAPRRFPAAEATARAAGADDILVRAVVHEALADALAGCSLVYGTTARARRIDWPGTSPREAAREIVRAGADGEVALVFGREQAGLSNDELDRCQRAIRIPTVAGFRSLNLAQAVQICAYELRVAANELAGETAPPAEERDDGPAQAAAVERLAVHCLEVMAAVGYHDPRQPKLLERRVRRGLASARLLRSEVQILRGFLAAVQARVGRGGDD